MQYLQPIKALQSQVTLYRNLLLGCAGLLLISIVLTPMMMSEGNPFIIKSADSVALAKKEPWKFSVTRIEEFLKAYLESRFEWNETNFDERRSSLKSITSDAVMAKLKDSLSAYESINKSQKAKAFYVLEEFGFSNEKRQIEAHVTRVLRIQKVAVATPLIIQLEYRDAAVTEANPFGLQISALSEKEVN